MTRIYIGSNSERKAYLSNQKLVIATNVLWCRLAFASTSSKALGARIYHFCSSVNCVIFLGLLRTNLLHTNLWCHSDHSPIQTRLFRMRLSYLLSRAGRAASIFEGRWRVTIQTRSQRNSTRNWSALFWILRHGGAVVWNRTR